MGKRFVNGLVDPRRMVCAKCLHDQHDECVNVTLEKVGSAPLCQCGKESQHGDA